MKCAKKWKRLLYLFLKFLTNVEEGYLCDEVEEVGDKNNRDIWLLKDSDLPISQRAGHRNP